MVEVQPDDWSSRTGAICEWYAMLDDSLRRAYQATQGRVIESIRSTNAPIVKIRVLFAVCSSNALP